MKKGIALLIVLVLMFTFVGCSAEKPAGSGDTGPEEIKFPERTITLVNPWAPGGSTDVVARHLANELEGIFGKSVVVVNKTGGSGAIAINEVSKAAPDGYTLLINDKSFVSSYYMGVTDIHWSEMDPVCRLDAATHTIVVHNDSEWQTAADFVAAAKANPGEITIGVSGIGGMSHLTAENFRLAAGIDLKMVSFEGAAESRTALAGRHIDAVSAQLGEVKSFVDSGDMRMLAIADSQRHPAFPDVPTFYEEGLDFELNQWRAIWAPKGTPRPIIEKLAAAFKEAMESEKFNQLLEETLSQNLYLGPDDLRTALEDQDEVLKNLVTDSGLLK
ncbi:MAG: tripartite tricarboxylate transporter substrate binding protein [bacterium]|jgi:tripartite-type tricarboxylate transporter receptor subunit TctC